MDLIGNLVSSIASNVPLIVGSIFVAVGTNMALHFYRFRKLSARFKGRVKAIEKYTSHEREDGHSVSVTLYRPIVEYIYKNEMRIAKGSSAREIVHKLNQNVPVLVHASEDGDHIQSMLDESSSVMFGAVFASLGILSLGVYIFSVGGSWPLSLVATAIASGLGYTVSSMILNFSDLVFPQTDQESTEKDSMIIETKDEYLKHVSHQEKWSSIIAFSFLIFSLGVVFFGIYTLPAYAKTLFFSDFSAFWDQLMSANANVSWTKPMIISGVGLFFFLASLHSIFHVRRKYGALTKA